MAQVFLLIQQTPFMDTTGTLVVVAVQVTPLPPLSPLQVHSLTPPGEGNAGVVGSDDPDAQKALLAPYPVSLKEYVFAADQQVPLMGVTTCDGMLL